MNILILDDQPSARAMLRHVVEGISPDIHVEDFGDPNQALEWSEHEETDLLLLDYRMPDMNGLEFAKRFKKPPIHRDVPIILITVVGDEPLRQAALDVGVTDFMLKPVRPRELRARCKNLLSLRQQNASVKQRVHSLERQVLAGIREANQREREMLYMLARAAEFRDTSGGVQLLRIGRYVGILAEALGISDQETQILELAAPLYDIGKIGIADAILMKNSELNAEEILAVQRHVYIGYDILKESSSRFVQLAAVMALRHHERWDGSGYPEGLSGEEIPLPARIIAIADVFDALTSDRPWRKAWSYEAAAAFIVEQSGKWFDADCVRAFEQGLPQIIEVRKAFTDISVTSNSLPSPVAKLTVE